jgi:lipopolysaccharide/colanic/teichoic acid biosynthesis glycosyltransferase
MADNPNENTKIIIERLPALSKRTFYRFIKRIFDIFCSFFLILIFSFPMLIIAVIVKLDGGSILFKQERFGLNGSSFMMLKFRTMVPDAEENGTKWTIVEDPRVTKYGKFLRKTRLDELPQFFNVIRGDMSLVGPRPLVTSSYQEFGLYIDGFDQRLLVKPGITGLAQINGGQDLKPEEKILYDIEYIKKRSFFFDIKILLKTIFVIFNHNGAR